MVRYVDVSAEEVCLREDFVSFIDAFGELKINSNNGDASSDTESEGNGCSDEDNGGGRSGSVDSETVEFSLTGVNLEQLILVTMKELNLNVDNSVAVGNDGCAVIIGNIGDVKEIQKECNNAVRTPCFSLKLNSSISKSSNVTVIKNTFTVIKEETRIFKVSRRERNTELSKFHAKNWFS